MEKKYIVWRHADYEGWHPDEYLTLKEARMSALKYPGETYPPKITRIV